jgi:hypothetical protein
MVPECWNAIVGQASLDTAFYAKKRAVKDQGEGLTVESGQGGVCS